MLKPGTLGALENSWLLYNFVTLVLLCVDLMPPRASLYSFLKFLLVFAVYRDIGKSTNPCPSYLTNSTKINVC